MELILASASPRRREILGRIVKDFSVLPARGEERSAETQPVPLVISLARAKAEEVASSHPKAAVLGADTVVWFEGRALGKPKDAADAKRTLRALSGRAHDVYTGYCLIAGGKVRTGACRTQVFFRDLSEAFIDEYVATGSPLDKAGSYGIQDDARLVARYEGSYTSMVWLPEEEVGEILREAGILE